MQGGRPPVRVQVAVAAPQDLPRTIASVGSLESSDMTTVSAEIDGRITDLDIPEGQLVEKGHVLARIDDAESKATLSVMRARRDNARDRLARLEKLRKQSVSSEQAYDDATAEYDAASGAYLEARSRLEKTIVTAPFTGVLGLEQVNVGQYAESGMPIVELTRVDPLELRFSVPQRYAADATVGQRLSGRVGSCGASFAAEVTAIDPRIDVATRSLRLEASVPNPDGTLLPGMAVSLRLVVGSIPQAIVVPQEAVVRQGTKHIAYVLDEEDRAQQRNVELGQFFVDGVHLVSGVEPGARVVTAGQQKLRPGAATDPEPFEPVDNPNLELGRIGPEGRCDPTK